ncbi:MAG: terminase family protein [Fimbriimonadaceae bacterium]
MPNLAERLHSAWKPHPGQAEFLAADARIRVLACGRRWGKTDASAASIVLAMGDRPTRTLILAPTLDQARLLFDRTAEMLAAAGADTLKSRRSPFPALDWQGHTVVARSGHVGRALRGNEATHIVVDEAAFVPEELVAEVALPMLAATDGRLTLISTPRGHNHFWRFFEMGVRNENGVWSRRAPTAESPYVRPEFLELQRGLISERAYAVEYEAAFLDGAGQVFRTESVDACLVPELGSARGPVAIGVDWARYRDFTAVAVLVGTREQATLVEIDRFHDLGWREQVDRVCRIVARYPGARVWCDATGVGDPLLEMVQSRVGARVRGLTFTSTAKAEIVDNLAWMFESRAIRMRPEPELLKELQHFERRESDSGSVRLGAAGGFHDDLVVALALAAKGLPRFASASVFLGETRKFRCRPSPRLAQVRFGADPADFRA